MNNKTLAMILVSVFLWTHAAAQELYSLTESQQMVGKNNITGLLLHLKTVNSETQKALSRYLKKEYKINCKGKWNMVATECKVAEVSGNPFNLFIDIDKKQEENSEVFIYFSFGDEVAVPTRFPSEFAAIKKIIDRFARTFLIDQYNEQIRRDEKHLSDLKKSTKKLTAEYKDLSKELQKFMKETQKQIEEIQQNTNDLNAVNEKMAASNAFKAEANAKLEELQNQIQLNKEAMLVYQNAIRQNKNAITRLMTE